MLVCFAETVDSTVRGNGGVQQIPASPLQGRLLDSTPSIYRDETRLKTTEGYDRTAPVLSEGTITDSTPGSAVNHYTPSIEEGTILSSVSSYRSIAEPPPGLFLPPLFYILFLYIICILAEELHVYSKCSRADIACLYHHNSWFLSCRIYREQLKKNATLEMQ